MLQYHSPFFEIFVNHFVTLSFSTVDFSLFCYIDSIIL
jgi:hypothetical protein